MLDRRAEKLVREYLKLRPAIAPPGAALVFLKQLADQASEHPLAIDCSPGGLREASARAPLLIGRRAWNP